MDWTDRALLKIYTKFGWFSACQNEQDRVKLIRLLFNTVLQVNESFDHRM